MLLLTFVCTRNVHGDLCTAAGKDKRKMAFSSYDNMVAYLLSEMDTRQGTFGNHFLWDLSDCACVWLQKSLQVDGNYVPNEMWLCRDAWGGQKARIFSAFFIRVTVHFCVFLFFCCIVPLRNKQRQIVFITFVFVSAEVQTLNQLQQCFVLGFVF